MANSYATLAELKAQLPSATFTSADDALLTSLLERASRDIDRATSREPGAYYVTADAVRYFMGSGERRLLIDELAAAPTTVEVAETGDLTDYTTWASTDYIAYPWNAAALSEPFWALDIDILNGTKTQWPPYEKAVKITGKFGFSAAIPADIKQATIAQAVRWWKRSQQAFQDVGAIKELGQLHYVKGLDPQVAMLVMDYKRVVF